MSEQRDSNAGVAISACIRVRRYDDKNFDEISWNRKVRKERGGWVLFEMPALLALQPLDRCRHQLSDLEPSIRQASPHLLIANRTASELLQRAGDVAVVLGEHLQQCRIDDGAVFIFVP